jgi:hypothetical protein
VARAAQVSTTRRTRKLLVLPFTAAGLGLKTPFDVRRERVAAALRETPESSDRRIGRATKANHHRVAAVRRELEATGVIPHVTERVDAGGRRQRLA